MRKDEVNVLSLDGGGIRGLISADILSYIEGEINKKTSRNLKIGEYFDLIVGTSTGGILSSIYTVSDNEGKFKYSALDSKNLYLENGKEIFKRTFFRKLKTLFGLKRPKYSNSNLKNILVKYLGENTKMRDVNSNLMLSSIKLEDSSPYLFKSYNENTYDNKLIDACLSTSAAPTYFPPHKVGESYLIDGGLAINNPTISAYIEAKKLFPNKKINILSIGTGSKVGNYNNDGVKTKGIIWWVKKIIDITLISSVKITEYQSKKLHDEANVKEYLRIEPNLFKSSTNMDDISDENITNMLSDSKLTIEMYKNLIDNFIKKVFI